ncbi:MAG: protein-L-isoaspartate(D-aspartate) O-methyltransferase, partial [Sphaerochaeta sp.]|nr:protein-L-isoaspartate(D-aspartate) O-methyltransferase [Sphaerochaeta sp.]
MREKLQAFFETLDRSRFIDNQYKALAKLDRPLPIGHGQTISQPSLVVYMTEALKLEESSRVLEIGTGSGYQSAFLCAFSKELYTVEVIPALSQRAQEKLTQLGYTNIQYKIGDGSEGWIEHAPYDRIMVTAAPKELPITLIQQLAIGGIMVLPVGHSGWQELKRITKTGDGTNEEEKLLDVAFVEMVG